MLLISKEFLPAPLATMMVDENSEIIDFYPEKFRIDLNGKKFSWQGIYWHINIDDGCIYSKAHIVITKHVVC